MLYCKESHAVGRWKTYKIMRGFLHVIIMPLEKVGGGGGEEKEEKPQTEYSVSELNFEPGTSLLRSWSDKHCPRR
jgi:hypothetical protein